MNLPPQQSKCLSYLSMGMTYKEIGEEMTLSPRTVEYYVNILKKKTGAKKRSALMYFFFSSTFKEKFLNHS